MGGLNRLNGLSEFDGLNGLDRLTGLNGLDGLKGLAGLNGTLTGLNGLNPTAAFGGGNNLNINIHHAHQNQLAYHHHQQSNNLINPFGIHQQHLQNKMHQQQLSMQQSSMNNAASLRGINTSLLGTGTTTTTTMVVYNGVPPFAMQEKTPVSYVSSTSYPTCTTQIRSGRSGACTHGVDGATSSAFAYNLILSSTLTLSLHHHRHHRGINHPILCWKPRRWGS